MNTNTHNEVKDLTEQLAIATTKLEQSEFRAKQLDEGWNNTLVYQETLERLLDGARAQVGQGDKTIDVLSDKIMGLQSKLEQSEFRVEELRQTILDMSATQNYLAKDNAHLTTERAYWREKSCRLQSK